VVPLRTTKNEYGGSANAYGFYANPVDQVDHWDLCALGRYVPNLWWKPNQPEWNPPASLITASMVDRAGVQRGDGVVPKLFGDRPGTPAAGPRGRPVLGQHHAATTRRDREIQDRQLTLIGKRSGPKSASCLYRPWNVPLGPNLAASYPLRWGLRVLPR